MSSSAPRSSLQRYPAVPFVKQPGLLARVAGLVVPPLILVMALLCLYAWIRAGLPQHRLFLMPSGFDLWEKAFALSEVRRELAWRALTTLGIAVAGLCLSIPFGIMLAIIMFRALLIERALLPNIVLLQAIPTLAIIPLIQTALGFGLLPKILIVAKFTLFSVPITLLLGFKSIDRGTVDLFRLQGVGWGKTLIKACFPAALPALFAGLRIAASLAVISAISSELFFLAGRGGLGQMIINAKIDFKYEQMYAALITATGMSLCVYVVFAWLGHKLFAHWHESADRQG